MFDFKLPNISIEQDLELNSDVLKRIPKYHRYLLISPQDCYTFPHIDHEGTAIFNYQLVGEKVNSPYLPFNYSFRFG